MLKIYKANNVVITLNDDGSVIIDNENIKKQLSEEEHILINDKINDIKKIID